MNTMRPVLMLAYVFPPFFSAGGSIRAVKFCKYLPALGWRPLVLTIDDQQETVSQRREGSAALLQEIPPEVRIFRTNSGEVPAHIQQRGREARKKNRLVGIGVNLLSWLRRTAYRYLLLPDAHITWLPSALKKGRQIVRDEQVDVVWATCPPHSTAVTAAALKRLTGCRLVLDYRDDWIDTPWFKRKPGIARWIERRLERWAVRTADRVVLVTKASREAFLARYPRQPKAKFVLITNGCDLKELQTDGEESATEAFHIVHAGHLSIDQGWRRSPEAFFEALRKIVDEHPALAGRLQVTFTGHLPEPYRRQIEHNGLKEIVCEAGFVPQEEYPRLLRSADLLLAINYESFSTLIPGKIYEYWAAGRAPILLLDGEGAACSLVREHNLGLCVPPDDVTGIAAAIVDVDHRREAGTPLQIDTTHLAQYDRKALARQLADLLAEVSQRTSVQ